MNTQLQIVNRSENELPDFVTPILQTMFDNYLSVTIRRELAGGLSGSHVYLIRPVHSDGALLPSVIKLDRLAPIRREWQAYQNHIQYRLPRVAEIHNEPAIPDGSEWGGLWYPLVGAGAFEISSFADYYLETETADLQQFLSQQLFVALSQLWNMSTIEPDFHVQTMYDSFLPMNLEVTASQGISELEKKLSPQTAVRSTLQPNDPVSLAGFRVARVSQQQNRLSLDAPTEQPAAYRLSYFAESVDGYEEGQIVTLPGIVRKTRQDLLIEQAQKAMGDGVDVAAVTLRTSNGTILSNPIHRLPQLLAQTFDARISSIHGDLNLQNILVETQSTTAYLIDFAKAGRNHVLRDLICLETNIVTRLLPIALTEAILTPEAIIPFYRQLHCTLRQSDSFAAPAGLEKPFAVLKTIRETAVRYLFDPNNWTEYYTGLLIYLLGSLKFNDLDTLPFAPMPKQIAFWGAAAIQQLLDEGDSACVEPITSLAAGVGGAERVTPTPPVTPQPQSRRHRRSTDSYSSYERGLKQLLAQLDHNSQDYADALLFQQRLTENINRSRRFGSTISLSAERAEIIDELNRLALATVAVSFNQLCR